MLSWLIWDIEKVFYGPAFSYTFKKYLNAPHYLVHPSKHLLTRTISIYRARLLVQNLFACWECNTLCDLGGGQGIYIVGRNRCIESNDIPHRCLPSDSKPRFQPMPFALRTRLYAHMTLLLMQGEARLRRGWISYDCKKEGTAHRLLWDLIISLTCNFLWTNIILLSIFLFSADPYTKLSNCRCLITFPRKWIRGAENQKPGSKG